MPEPFADHNKILAAAAKDALGPLGFVRKGRSRVWIADQRFWAIIVEFQPSSFSKGSYLNVGAHWFWHPIPWSFDFAERVNGFVPFEHEQQFEADIEVLAQLAAEVARRLKSAFASLEDVARVLAPWADSAPGPWHLYHAAMAAGLAGDRAAALDFFARLLRLRRPAEVAWEKELQTQSATFASKLADLSDFRATVLAIIQEARRSHRFAPDPTCLDPA